LAGFALNDFGAMGALADLRRRRWRRLTGRLTGNDPSCLRHARPKKTMMTTTETANQNDESPQQKCFESRSDSKSGRWQSPEVAAPGRRCRQRQRHRPLSFPGPSKGVGGRRDESILVAADGKAVESVVGKMCFTHLRLTWPVRG
jgi:hypothetical protein